jgi:HTH-type transcriptional regulator, transcriptional repressor of NAD biosynthesis genes
MNKAFIFGKFLPFHKGHEALINFALKKCDFLSVLVCCSDQETIPANVRMNWIMQTFDKQDNLDVKAYNYSEDDFPNTSVSSEEVSAIWAPVFKQYYPDYSSVITSEPYGIYIAQLMNIQHIPFDTDRKLIPISATAIRNDLFGNWKYLPNSVKSYYAIKVVLLGTESTGKTTLTKMLSEHFSCSFVLEAGREIIADSNSFSFKDLHLIAKEHSTRINNAIIGQSPLVIIDTDIHITKSYSRFTFGKEFDPGDDICNSNKASLYLYLNNDAAYFQDGTRLNESERNLLDSSHRQILAENNIVFIEITGNWLDRFKKAVHEIDKIIFTKAKN